MTETAIDVPDAPGTTSDPGRANRHEGGRLVTPVSVGIVIVWGLAAALAGRAGLFATTVNDLPVAIIGAVALPVAAFLIAWRTIPAVTAYVDTQDLATLTALQGWRVVGASFLFLWAYGLLPAAFALPAGIGDVAVGLAAPFAAIMVARRAAGWEKAAVGIIVAGLFDFVLAVGTGMATGTGNLLHVPGDVSSDLVQSLPLSLIPTYLVPLFLIFHVMAIIRLRAMRR